MLLGLPSQMGIKLDLDRTHYISFESKSYKYFLQSISMAKTSDLTGENFRLVSEQIVEMDKNLKVSCTKEFANYCFTNDKIFAAYVSRNILNTLRIGAYEYQSKLLREKWQSTTQQNNYRKLSIG